MKKIGYVLLTLCLILPFVAIPPTDVQGQTLGDLKRELEQFVEDYNNNKFEQKMTEQQIEQTKNSIMQSNREIQNISDSMIQLNKEIEQLEKDIEEKDKEIKQIINYVEISNGESAYLEYIFGAKDFTDFIYRAAVSEQLTKYNDQLIKEYNQNIIDNNNKKKELDSKKAQLQEKQKQLGVSLEKLHNNQVELEESSISIEDEIESLRKAIDMYENQYGCKDNEDLKTCGRNILPPDTAFWRPLVSGYVTADYGYYNPFGQEVFHYGLDMSTVDNNAPVYAAANGLVVSVPDRQSCGNRIVYITHNINGVSYTTSYWHMRKVFVEVGDRVTKDTQIGIMGGASSDHDECATGPHVHFVVATGLYTVDYKWQWQFNERRIDPRLVLNAPPEGGYFKNRTTKY